MNLVQRTEEQDFRGDVYKAVCLTPEGLEWLRDNAEKLSLRDDQGTQNDIEITGDDIPF